MIPGNGRGTNRPELREVAPAGDSTSFADQLREARELAATMPRNPIATACGWGFVVFGAIAIGHGLWTLYGSGSMVSRLDISSAAEVAAPATGEAPCLSFGQVPLAPGMSPMRAILRTTFAPLGSSRMHYVIGLADAGGVPVWEQRGFIGSRSSDQASVVKTTDRLVDFDVQNPGEYQLLVRFEPGSMDDLRDASVELRRNVAQPDPRIVWGFGVASALCLISSIIASRRTPYPYAASEHREAA